MARKNNPPFFVVAVVAAAALVFALAITTTAAATSIAPLKDRIAEVVIGGKTLTVETIPVFAETKWFGEDGMLIAEIPQVIRMTMQEVIRGGKTATVQVQDWRSYAVLGNKTITIEIADDHKSRVKGLSGRQTISGGMLFIYSAAREICLWMNNTHISLEALFLHADGTIINSAQMIPHTTNRHCSATKKAKYALELPAEWRKQNQVQNVKKVILPPHIDD